MPDKDTRFTLHALIDKAGDWLRTATPEEKDAMLKAQQKSWVRGEKRSAETYSLRRPAQKKSEQ